MKKISLLFVFATSILLMSNCTFNSTYINREEDNREGEEFVNKFYKNVASKNLTALDTMVSDTLKKIAGPDGISKLITLINTKVGDYKTDSIADHYVTRTTGSNNFTSYNYKVKVTYSKGVVDEIIGLRKMDNGQVKLTSYHANSDLLIK